MRCIPFRLVAWMAGVVGAGDAAFAQTGGPAIDGLSIGMTVGMAVLIVFAALIGLSVVSKLLIVFGIVPKEPTTPIHFLTHALANFVGGLRVMRRSGERRGNIAWRDPSGKTRQ